MFCFFTWTVDDGGEETFWREQSLLFLERLRSREVTEAPKVFPVAPPGSTFTSISRINKLFPNFR